MPTPSLLYGTAWKEDLTEDCVYEAIRAGFRAVDTANQRKHYFEEGAGKGIKRACAELGLRREDLFLQTKFTYARGQDHRKPYDERAALSVQVQQSFESSLHHLGTDYVDSYVLHGPSGPAGLTDADWETWAKMEELFCKGGAKALGVSNVDLAQLEELHAGAKVRPAYVQNRCYAQRKWDREIRQFCREKGIVYQGFSLLTANAQFLGGEGKRPVGRNVPKFEFSGTAPGVHPKLKEIVRQSGKALEQVVFRFCQQVGMLPITGTRDPAHMRLDLALGDFSLTAEQLETIENVAYLS